MVHGPTCYRSAAYHPLRPWQVRERRFRPTPFGRRRLDPQEVTEFLGRVRDALRRWQSEQARARNERSYGR
ncbi:DivIVA domain-containing protein [Micromonospora sp. KLBMP9576]|uniref:DivIVA domain-containing protein n=1 Tax=Micromonospora sp. KLBMP9576 TaxID=3424769 RepID=UPI003D8B243F